MGGSILQWGAAKGLTARCFPAASEALRAQDHAAGPGLVAAHPGLTKYGTPDFAGPDDQPGAKTTPSWPWARQRVAAAAAAEEEAAAAALAAARAERLAANQAAAVGLLDAARLYWDTDLTVSEIAALLGLPPAHKRTVYRLAGPRTGSAPRCGYPQAIRAPARRRHWRGELPGLRTGRSSI